MGRIIVLTGTDTGVGKTYVTCLLAEAMRREGRNFKVCKPVETGCRSGADGELIPEDGEKLREAGGGRQQLSEVTPYRFSLPLAPATAAALEGKVLRSEEVEAHLRALAASTELLLIEGAGGLLVPLAGRYTFADLAAALGAEVIVVVGSKLGAINHTLLTLEVLSRRAIPCLGYIVNDLCAAPDNLADHPERDALLNNRRSLLEQSAAYGVVELGRLPYRGDARETQDAVHSIVTRLESVPPTG